MRLTLRVAGIDPEYPSKSADVRVNALPGGQAPHAFTHHAYFVGDNPPCGLVDFRSVGFGMLSKGLPMAPSTAALGVIWPGISSWLGRWYAAHETFATDEAAPDPRGMSNQIK